MNRRAVVLLSGGLDSSTVLYSVLKNGYECFCLAFDYGQRHKKELNSARKLAAGARCPLKVVNINLPWDKSSLVNKSSKIPLNFKNLKNALPSTYVPGRNTIFISFALSYAETIKAEKIFIGANAVDYSGYPDCRPKYYKALNKVLKSLDTNIKIETPLLKLTKAGIIRLGYKLKVPYGLTWSCYKGSKRPCGKCDSCRYREKGFKQAGLKDPLSLPIRHANV